MSCDIQVNHQGVPVLAEIRLRNHRPCLRPARYGAVFDLEEQLLSARVCVEHSNEALYPLEMWRQQHPEVTHLPADSRFVRCIRMWSLPPEVYRRNLAASELSSLAHA